MENDHNLSFEEINTEIKESVERFNIIEQEGKRNYLKYFDRIHNKLFSFNNLMIAGYFALSRFYESFSNLLILVPIINMFILLFIDARLLSKSSFDAEITHKNINEMKLNSLYNRDTFLVSFFVMFSTAAVMLIFLIKLFLITA